MFTKRVPNGGANVRIRSYKTVIDWDAVGGAAVLVVIALVIINVLF
ncbi:hypothetical protein [Amorphus sp. 3PC139-8]